MSGTGALGQIGAACFGITVGYLTYRTLVRTAVNGPVVVLTAVAGAVGGAALTGLFAPGTSVFAWYSIGLLAAMAASFAIFGRLNGLQRLAVVLSVKTAVRGDDSGSEHRPESAAAQSAPEEVR